MSQKEFLGFDRRLDGLVSCGSVVQGCDGIRLGYVFVNGCGPKREAREVGVILKVPKFFRMTVLGWGSMSFV